MKPARSCRQKAELSRAGGTTPRNSGVLSLFFLFWLLGAAGLAPGAGFAAAPLLAPILNEEGLLKLISGQGAGKVIILSVFASWCPPCREEFPLLVRLRKEIPEEKLLLAGITADTSMLELHNFMREHKVNFPVYAGTRALFQVMRVSAIPHTFIFNRQGELIESVVGLMPEARFVALLGKLLTEEEE
jgi:thiol-disulfide isomerase/thioredoxin